MSSIAKVGIAFKADLLDPAEVTRIMGIEPTWAHAKGELSPKMKRPRPWGVWGFERDSAEVDAAAAELLRALAEKRPAIALVKERFGAEVNVTLWWEPEGGQGGYSLFPETLAALAGLGDRVDFYFASTGGD